MMRSNRLASHFALVAVCGLGAGCALFNSSSRSLDSISTSLQSMSTSFESSSESSKDDGDSANAAFDRDVRNFTAAFVESPASPDEFMRNLGRIAEQHGVSHWERERATFAAVGAGLRQAGVDPVQLRAFQESLAGVDPELVRSLLEGTDS